MMAKPPIGHGASKLGDGGIVRNSTNNVSSSLHDLLSKLQELCDEDDFIAKFGDWLCELTGSFQQQQEQQQQADEWRRGLALQLKFNDVKDLFEVVLKTFVAVSYKRYLHPKRSKHIYMLFHIIHDLKWHKIFGNVILAAINTMIVKEHILETCSLEFERSFIAELTAWVSKDVLSFAQALLGVANLNHQTGAITSYMRTCLCELRTSELFDIIADFPESISALRDLKDCQDATNSLTYTSLIFRQIVQKRLLHLGASTSQILDLFVSMIKALRILDPSDTILNFVSIPIRTYLLSRWDTVRCIVSSLVVTGEGGGSSASDLQGELKKGRSLEFRADEDDEEAGPGENWVPRVRYPELSLQDLKDNLQKTSYICGQDALSLLVSIFGSTDIFVNEYRTLLADKLLNNSTFITDSEVATLELLKIRFGEESLHNCEVMLHDIEESKRIRMNAQSEMAKMDSPQVAIDYVIISEHYWPPLNCTWGSGSGQPADGDIRLHPSIAVPCAKYEDIFASIKKPRRLHRHTTTNDNVSSTPTSLGVVDLDLEFDNGYVRSFSVTPAHASLILYMSERNDDDSDDSDLETKDVRGSSNIVTSSKLAEICGLDVEAVKNLMVYWVTRKVVRVINGNSSSSGGGDFGDEDSSLISYEIIEDQTDDTQYIDDSCEDHEGALGSNSRLAQEKASLDLLYVYTRGLLTSNDSMTVERIHSMLKVISSGDTSFQFDYNLVKFRQILQKFIDEDKLECIDGAYRVKQKK